MKKCKFVLPKRFDYGFTYCSLEEGHLEVGDDHRDGLGAGGGNDRWVLISEYWCRECGTAADAEDQAVVDVLKRVLKEVEINWPTAARYIRDLMDEYA